METNPKMTLAKFKSSLNIRNCKEDLIYLHDKGIIEWSGYKAAKKSLEDNIYHKDRKEVIDYMNELYGRNFGYDKTNVIERIKEHGKEKALLVVANRYAAWSGDAFMKKYLRPETIFQKKKFEMYLEEAETTNVGEKFISVKRFKIEKGTEITKSIAENLSKDELYKVRVCTKIGEESFDRGTLEDKLGKDLLKSITFRDSGQDKNFIIYYEGE